ncbi:hypothetical protein KKF84_00610 [Myxococcota bacterium]|nr:hypothetical protein [Myxococcota bacterium]MBU1533786.1 hypothetical protein [Myxococcota bacterium]
MKATLFTVAALLTLFIAACDDDTGNNNNANLCAEVTCTQNAHCEAATGTCACDTGYDLDAELCVDEKAVECLDEAPLNALSEIVDVTITFDSETGWSTPTPCAWDCLVGYSQEEGACVPDEVEVPLDGFGLIDGQCGVLDATNLTSTEPWYFVNTIDFTTDTYDASDFDQLSEGGQILATTENAGGSSAWSEVFSYEVLYRCELAGLLKTETQIVYDDTGSITDILMEIDGYKIGVSVVRAMSWPRDTPYTVSVALDKLSGKLEGIQESTALVSEEDRWNKQILHVLADRVEHLTSIEDALSQIDPAVRGDTIVLVTVTEGADDFIYTNEI